MQKTIGIIVFDGVLTSEVTGPVEVFVSASHHEWFKDSRVLLIGVEPTPTIRTEEGLTLGVDCTIADEVVLDVLIVPGANDVDALIEHVGLNHFIRQQDKTAEWVSSVCAGAFILGSAGVLDGKKATTWFGGEESLQQQFPQIQVITNQPVVVDQRYITANGGLVSYRAALVLLAKLTSPQHAQKIYQALGIERLGDWADIESSL